VQRVASADDPDLAAAIAMSLTGGGDASSTAAAAAPTAAAPVPAGSDDDVVMVDEDDGDVVLRVDPAASASGGRGETLREAIARLRAALPAEPETPSESPAAGSGSGTPSSAASGSGASGRCIRLQLRLPSGASPAAGVPPTPSGSAPAAGAAVTRQRRFSPTTPVDALFAWASLCWLEAAAGAGADAASPAAATPAAAPLAVRPFVLQVGGIPPKRIFATGEVKTGPATADSLAADLRAAAAVGGSGAVAAAAAEPATLATVFGASLSASLTLHC